MWPAPHFEPLLEPATARNLTRSVDPLGFDALREAILTPKIGLHVEPIEAAHVAGRIDAGEMNGAHAESLEIVQRLTL
jgi:hypothetical protein